MTKILKQIYRILKVALLVFGSTELVFGRPFLGVLSMGGWFLIDGVEKIIQNFKEGNRKGIIFNVIFLCVIIGFFWWRGYDIYNWYHFDYRY
ncbi:hypothetical protein ACSVDA_06680 [Cytobacillus sp. Hm23]